EWGGGAGGGEGVVAAGQSGDPVGWKGVRGSGGRPLRLPIASRASVDEAVAEARRHRCRIVATLPRGGTPLSMSDLRVPVAILIGGEGHGLPTALVEAADVRITIPMQAPVESLNAAVTAALVAYEVRRQRSGTKWTRCFQPTPSRRPVPPPLRSRSACDRAGSTNSSARRNCWLLASRCARRSSAICSNRSSSGVRPAQE